MSVMENAQQLASQASRDQERGLTQQISDAVQAQMGAAQQIKASVEDFTSIAASLLGEGHRGTEAITGVALAVVLAVEDLTGQLANIEAATNVVIDQLGVMEFTIGNVAQDVMNSGG